MFYAKSVPVKEIDTYPIINNLNGRRFENNIHNKTQPSLQPLFFAANITTNNICQDYIIIGLTTPTSLLRPNSVNSYQMMRVCVF